jgi:septal ring factor EnvC (AmiA/AmiB activator)
MPRTKGSKNRPKTNITKDYASQIAEKQETIVSLTAEIASITTNIDTLKADLKEKKTALKKTEKEAATLEAKKAKADAKAADNHIKFCGRHIGALQGMERRTMKTTLLIMVASIGSRFGTGIKQLEPVDDAGHIIMDYSIFLSW